MRTQSPTVLADILRPAAALPVWLVAGTQVSAGALAIALAAQVHLYLPFTPVPVTLQTLAVLLVGAALGSRKGASAAAAYVICGAVGLPLFSAGGFGLAKLAGPTGGYLLGFILAAWLVGWISERGGDRRPATALVAMLAGNLVIYLCGLPWLALFTGIDKILSLGLYPFIAGDLAKALLASLALPGAWQIARMTGLSLADNE